MMPPSPRLSARMISSTYLSETTIISAQKIVDRPAEDVLRSERNAVAGREGFLDGVERAGADVAEDDAEREQRQRRAGLLLLRSVGQIVPFQLCRAFKCPEPRHDVTR